MWGTHRHEPPQLEALRPVPHHDVQERNDDLHRAKAKISDKKIVRRTSLCGTTRAHERLWAMPIRMHRMRRVEPGSMSALTMYAAFTPKMALVFL